MKPIFIISILFQLLSYTGRSQTITIENNKLCFDSAASVELYKTIVDRESFAQEIDVYQELYTSYDSLLASQESYKTFLRNEVARLYTASEEMKAKYNNAVSDGKKQKRKWFWIGTTTGLSLPLILMILIK